MFATYCEEINVYGHGTIMTTNHCNPGVHSNKGYNNISVHFQHQIWVKEILLEQSYLYIA
jgi:uncharacterized membrane protein YagU involved in acid resistance